MFWVPQSGDIGMGVSILSYDGAVQFGLITDRGLCPDPDHVIAHFAPEFEKLVLTTLMAPWPWVGDLDPELAAMVVDPGAAGAATGESPVKARRGRRSARGTPPSDTGSAAP